MNTTTEKHKSRHRADSDDERGHKKRRKDKKEKKEKKEKDRHRHGKHKSKQGISVVDDESGEDVWVEKNIDGEGDQVSVYLFAWK
ncbi:hypothetical protein FRC12_009575 [Ceratobasidium sp. 428]|nr:hypothetical protein FRC12_009575 [Ceratobasidium sp. 428]